MLQNTEIIESQEIIGVSGSSGHIGSHLFNKYTSFGTPVIRLDREGNVPQEVTKVFNLAAYGNKYTQIDKYEIYKANVDMVKKLLENSKGKTVVLTSTSSVLLPIQTDYSKSKQMMEDYVKEWVTMTDENVIIARPSTVVGIGEDPNRLIPKLINSCLTDEPMDFIGEPIHDFIDVQDFIEGMIFLSNQASRYKGQVFNVSFGISVSNELIKGIVEEITGKKANINRVESLRNYDTKDWKVPSYKLRALGWRPKKDVFVTIEEMVNEYKLKNVK